MQMMHSYAAFAVIRSLSIRRVPCLPSPEYLCSPSYARTSSALGLRPFRSPLSSHSIQCHGVHSRLVTPAISFRLLSNSNPVLFDKVPKSLPDWWDDDDDDDDDDDGDDDDEDEDQRNNGGDASEERTGPHDGGSDSDCFGGSGPHGRGGGGRGSGDHDDNAEEGIFATILALYVRAVQNAPVRTKAISTCLLALVGDILAQRIAQRELNFIWDPRRSAAVGVWGLFFMGPVLHYWYGTLDRLFLGRFSVWQKLLSDQLLFAPFFNGAFIAGVGRLEGMSGKDTVTTLKSKLWPSMKANWILWPAAQFVNFAFIPKTFQIVYVNSVALVWNIILTYISHGDYGEEMNSDT